MKTLPIKLIASVIILFALTQTLFTFNDVKKETVTIKCDKMHCEGCKSTIIEAVQAIDGVSKIDVDLKTKIIKVTFDNKKTSKAAISGKILEAGYENEIIK